MQNRPGPSGRGKSKAAAPPVDGPKVDMPSDSDSAVSIHEYYFQSRTTFGVSRIGNLSGLQSQAPVNAKSC